jgi:hypothetical protein
MLAFITRNRHSASSFLFGTIDSNQLAGRERGEHIVTVSARQLIGDLFRKIFIRVEAGHQAASFA